MTYRGRESGAGCLSPSYLDGSVSNLEVVACGSVHVASAYPYFRRCAHSGVLEEGSHMHCAAEGADDTSAVDDAVLLWQLLCWRLRRSSSREFSGAARMW